MKIIKEIIALVIDIIVQLVVCLTCVYVLHEYYITATVPSFVPMDLEGYKFMITCVGGTGIGALMHTMQENWRNRHEQADKVQ